MDVLESLNGMLIKGLGCGLRCKDHHQHHNVPLEMSVISGETRQLRWPPDAPPAALQPQGWLVWTLQCASDKNDSASTSLQPEYRREQLLCVRI